MANVIYPLFKQAQLTADTGTDIENGDLRVILVDTADYTYSSSHDFLNDVLSAARVSVSPQLTSVTVTNGLLDAADTTFSAVTGDVSEALVLYLHTGTETTSRLVAYIDTGVTGLPVTPNGGDIDITWNASGIIQF